MKIAYFDCFSGISGDMCLGALIDAGVSLEKLKKELKKIPIQGYEILAKKVKRAGIAATKVDVIQKAKSKELRAESKETYSIERRATGQEAYSIERRAKSNTTPLIPPLARGPACLPSGRDKEGSKGRAGGAKSEELGAKKWKDIERIIHESSLSIEIREKGLEVFRRLFKAEAKIHGETFDSVHLHELGAIDCLIDIFGTIIGLDILKIEKVYSSHVNLGSGSVKTEHGILPVPAPAPAEVLKGVPVYSTDIKYELTTPTGASLVKELSSGFGSIPLMNVESIGLGAGNRNFKDRPNVLRLFIGNSPSTPYVPPHLTPLYPPLLRGELKGGSDMLDKNVLPTNRRSFLTLQKESSDEKVTVIEANIDDMNPQIYEYVMDKLFKTGALDVFLTQILMKKGRPGIKLTVICKETDGEELIKIIMKETTTIGLRFYDVQRRVLQREVKLIDTEFGKVRVKLSRLGDEILKATPEYEDCKRIAKKLNMPLVEIIRRITLQVKIIN